MGTPEFAVRSLEACLDVGDVVAVVTQPDKPKGRGQELAISPVKALAQQRGIPVLQPPKIRGTPFHEEIRALRPEVGVVTAYGKILPQELLDAPARGCVNVHASLLPRFRGAAPIQWAIAAGDAKTGVCLMKMDAGLDTGPVIDRRERPIGPEDTSATLHDALSALGGELIRQSLPRYLRGELQPVPQPPEGVVLAPLIKKEDGRLDFARPAAELERRTRAFHPWPGTYTSLGGKTLKVVGSRVGQGRGGPGEVLEAGAGGVEVACGEGSLVLLTVQPEGKRAMSAREFLAGHPLQKGSRPFGGESGQT
jgi:methionyl-tRNA formyltransferase